MAKPTFDDLPFWERPDLTPYLIHLTKRSRKGSAFENLVRMLEGGVINASGRKGFIKGSQPASCFMDIPFGSLKYLLNNENSGGEYPRYEPFGIVVLKTTAYKRDCRPVIYLAPEEEKALNIPARELWRVVRFELSENNCVSWVHEREWRCKGDYTLPREFVAAVVKNPYYAKKLQKILSDNSRKFAARPKSILPLSIICQGLIYI